MRPLRRQAHVLPRPLLHAQGRLSQSQDDHRELHSFPTRRSSDLSQRCSAESALAATTSFRYVSPALARIDRKSTRLNSSHVAISYAVLCLKKKIPAISGLDPTTNAELWRQASQDRRFSALAFPGV